MPRMQILSPSEQEAVDGPPVFDFRERKRCYDLPKPLLDIATELRSPASQIGFLVMCTYFKAAKKFYNPRHYHAPDIEAAAKLLGLTGSEFSPARLCCTNRGLSAFPLSPDRLILQAQ